MITICTREDMKWGIEVFERVKSVYPGTELITDTDDLGRIPYYTMWVFFLHWSWKIPKEIFNKFDCVSFHPSPLPKYRGGSPIHNQLKDGITETKFTAFKTVEKMDAGDIYLQKDLSLEGNMDDIYKRMERLATEMIFNIIKNNPKPRPQTGKPTFYTRARAKDVK